MPVDLSLLDNLLGEGESRSQENLIPIVELEDGQIDPRYTRVSYSSLQDFHACPRYFQLKRLRAEVKEDWEANLTFAFGHAVGDGIASLMLGKSLEQVLFEMFCNWEVDFLAENDKQRKSIAHAVTALQMLNDKMQDGFLQEYQVAEFSGKPAIELSFKLDVPSSFTGVTFSYRGFLDVVMRSIATGEYMVLENKTSSGNYVNHVAYKNSAQALGYSVVLDELEGEKSAYDVTYLVYMTKLFRYEDFSFPKSYAQRALWLRDIMFDVSVIEKLVKEEGNYGNWPMRGESCYRFGRPCEFLDTCQLETKNLMKPLRENQLEETTEYDINYKVEDLI